jgi:hypothetical protein
MKKQGFFSLLSLVLLFSMQVKAQWEVGAGYGLAIPFTGYGEVVKSAGVLGISGGKRFSQEKWKISFEMDWARMHKDNSTGDEFENPRIDVVPMTFSVERQFGKHPKIKPFVGAGLGASIYNILYHSTTKGDVSEVNASFTLAPSLGINLRTESNINPFIKAKMVFVADGPPIGFPQSSKGTGYYAVSIGFNYLFK